jgi:hypothetical protein
MDIDLKAKELAKAYQEASKAYYDVIDGKCNLDYPELWDNKLRTERAYLEHIKKSLESMEYIKSAPRAKSILSKIKEWWRRINYD